MKKNNYVNFYYLKKYVLKRDILIQNKGKYSCKIIGYQEFCLFLCKKTANNLKVVAELKLKTVLIASKSRDRKNSCSQFRFTCNTPIKMFRM